MNNLDKQYQALLQENLSNSTRMLTELLEYFKEHHSNLPTHVFEVLGEVINDLKKEYG